MSNWRMTLSVQRGTLDAMAKAARSTALKTQAPDSGVRRKERKTADVSAEQVNAMLLDDQKLRRKPAEKRKELQLHVRVTEAQQAAFQRAAEAQGLDVSSWVRSTLLRAAGVLPG